MSKAPTGDLFSQPLIHSYVVYSGHPIPAFQSASEPEVRSCRSIDTVRHFSPYTGLVNRTVTQARATRVQLNENLADNLYASEVAQ